MSVSDQIRGGRSMMIPQIRGYLPPTWLRLQQLTRHANCYSTRDTKIIKGEAMARITHTVVQIPATRISRRRTVVMVRRQT